MSTQDYCPMKIKYSDILVFISIIIFVVACFFPAFYELGVIDADVTVRPTPGWACLPAGLFVPVALYGFYDPDINWILVWNANLFFLISIALYFASKKIRWQLIAIIGTMLIGLLFLLVDYPMYGYGINDDECRTIVELGVGYYLWLLSFFSMLLGICLRYYSQHSKHVHIVFLLSLVVISFGLFYLLTTNDKHKSNFISLDEENRCLIADDNIEKLIINDGIFSTLLVRNGEKLRKLKITELEKGFRIIPLDFSKSRKIDFSLKKNDAYTIFNISHNKDSACFVDFNYMPNGEIQRIPHVVDGDNHFYFDIENQCFVSKDYFGSLYIKNGDHYAGLYRKGIKKNVVGLNELYSYFSCKDSLLLYREAGEYIIENLFHHNDGQRIKIYVNQSARVDSFKYVGPDEY